MVDVARPLGIWNQLALIAGLRWRMLHNGLRKKQNRLDLIGMIGLAVVAGAIVISIAIGTYTAAYNFVVTGKEGWLALLFWAVFLWWQLFPVIVAGFGINFEFRALLRFPMSLSAFYFIGLAYGLADFTGAAALCWIIAMVIGAASANVWLLPALILVCAPFVLFNLTLERLLGSWLERILARRRGRELFFAGFILVMLSFQLVGPAMGRYGSSAGPLVAKLLPYFAYFPASLAGRGVESAATGKWGIALAEIGGIAAYAILFGALLWRRFAAQFRGEELSETAAPQRRAQPSRGFDKSEANALDVLSPQIAAMVRKEIRYLIRNGFAALLLLLPPILVFGLVTQLSVFRFTGSKSNISLDTFFPGLVAYLTLFLMSPAYNSFAYEGVGVQTYFTAPLRFREILLGKNFVQIGLLATELTLCIAAFVYRVGTPSRPVFIATLAAIVFTVVGQLSIANWSSLSFPRKLAFGQVHGQRQSGMAVLVAFGAQILLFGISTLVLALGRWTGDPWLPCKAFVLLAAAAIAGYVASLDPLTAYAEKKKERLIEALSK